MNDQILSQKRIIDQSNVDIDELKFLKLNLEHGHKCRKSFFNSRGFEVESDEYKTCVLSKGGLDG